MLDEIVSPATLSRLLRESAEHFPGLLQGLQGDTREKRPQSRRMTASLFINTREVMKKKRKFVVVL
eukprot:619468-Pelagomonas_calceolata.AAC.1